MNIKTLAVKSLNFLLAPIGAKVVKRGNDAELEDFEMSAALRRLRGRCIPINGIVDIGASDGKWSVLALEIFNSASVVAVEPLQERVGALERIRARHLKFNFETCVASDTCGETALHVTQDLDGSTIGGGDGAIRIVPAQTVAEIVKRYSLKPPYLLKFDTHGYEVPILAGASEILRDTSIIVMEVYNFRITETTLRFHEMCAFMEERGFRCCDIAGPMLRTHDKAFWQMDIFFTRSDHEMFSHSQYGS